MNREEIKNLLPHREPMLLVDEITVDEEGTAHGLYRVRGDEFFLQGHFPGNRVVPGVILCEIMAQACGLLIGDEIKGKTPVYTGLDKVRFRRSMPPGDEIRVTARIERRRGQFLLRCGGSASGISSACRETVCRAAGRLMLSILIANRGEIAVRHLRTCKEMGVQTVAVYSEADRDALHVVLADRSICIGPAPAAGSYLNMSAVISAAVLTGCQAIHPGYGLLSENARFAELCKKCGLAFIGPDAEIIEKMGSDAARRTMRQAGVPIVPGCDVVRDAEQAKQEAEKIGFPLLIKARAGGGGHSIRRVDSADEVERAFLAASSEAQAAFGDGACYMEKFLFPVKHIEMQLLCDHFGNIVCLGERECSMQRKKPENPEGKPSPSVDEETRKEMMRVSVLAAKRPSGTWHIEFLLTQDKKLPTCRSSIPSLKWSRPGQMADPRGGGRGAEFHAGGRASFRPRHRVPHQRRGPLQGLPSCGKITLLLAGGPMVRFDTALYPDYVIPPFYDIGKLIVHAGTRQEAIRKMQAALCEMVIEGVEINRELQLETIASKEFADGTYTTDFLNRLLKQLY